VRSATAILENSSSRNIAQDQYGPRCGFGGRVNLVKKSRSASVKHRGVDFDVEEDPPSWWHWKIYPKIEDGPKVIGDTRFRSREAAVASCIDEINSGLERSRRGGGSN
jgi:hypothetical protein